MKHFVGVTFQIAPDSSPEFDHPDDVEALGLWQLMSEGQAVIAEDNGGMVALCAANREFYLLFAEAQDYFFILARDTAPGIDKWRFTKKP
jgi:hypothetical protein